MLNLYVDTSGSISHDEMNKFLVVIKNFLKVGANNANIHLWHDKLYYSGKIKQNTTVEQLPTESGGTNPGDVIAHINKHKPDLAIILTDGQFSERGKLIPDNVIWVISDDQGKDHCYKTKGKTVLLKGVI